MPLALTDNSQFKSEIKHNLFHKHHVEIEKKKSTATCGALTVHG